MPVDTKHKQHQAFTSRWQRIRHVLDGEHAVKANAGTYLRKPEGMKFHEFGPYVEQTPWFSASERTLDGLTGAVFRRDPVVKVPTQFEAQLANITQRGADFVTFAKMAGREVIAMGRYGVLVDIASVGGEPYLAGYVAESIINWRTTLVNGVPTLSLVVLREQAEVEDPEDPFVTETRERYRVLRLDPPVNGGSAVYSQVLFEKQRAARGADQFVAIAGPITPTRRGEPFDFIPFQFFGPTDLGPDIQQAPLEPLVSMNLSHFATSAILENATWYVGAPFFVVKGRFVDGDQTGNLLVGSGTAWQVEESADVKILEFSGQGLNALEERRRAKEMHMTVLGARMLEDQKAGVEAAAAISLRHRGENSLLASIADTTGRGLSNVLSWAAWWAGGEPDGARVELGTDFVENPLKPQEVVNLVAAWQQGGIGGEVLFHNLKAGERLPKGWTIDDFERDLEQRGAIAAFLGFGDEESEAASDEIN